jgi:peptidoglycan/xylan/chitin deacetylase (PgdA/CDA1 family)
VLTVLRDQGYKSIYWDLDSWDSVKKGITADEITNRVTSKIRNGSIVLMHCGSQATADALDNLLTKLIESGYIPVTVSELLNL